jgi:hypothetical protein
MKALSGYAEWFWLMAKGWKDVENRNWSLTKYIHQLPVRIYLHASKTQASDEEIDFIHRLIDGERWEEFMAVDWEAIRGHIIGEITITDEVTHDDIGMKITKSPWFFGIYGFVVKDGKLLDKPIPYRGQLGFFEVNLPEVKT